MARVEDLLYRGSPFLIEVEQAVTDRILGDLRSDPSYYPGEAIAKRLGQVAGMQAARVLGEIGGLNRRFGTTPPDIARYHQGFDTPLLLLQLAYAGAVEGLAQARQMIIGLEANATKTFLLANLEYAVQLLRQDPTGRLLIRTITARENASNSNIYYRVGLEIAQRIFAAYSDVIEGVLQRKGYRVNPFPRQS